jgi:hypothetical protein
MPEEWTIPSAALSFATSAREAKQPWPRHAIGSAPDEGALGAIPPPGWVTLLRVDSDDHMNWGDSAWITFAIPQDALATGRFEAARAFPWIG